MTGRDPSSLVALETALAEGDRDRSAAPAWTWLAGLGAVAIATSTLLYWMLTPGPVGTLAVTTPPALLWVGLVVTTSGVVVGLARPALAPTPVAVAALLGALLVAASAAADARSGAAGPAPWLALAGALLTAAAASTAVARGVAPR